MTATVRGGASLRQVGHIVTIRMCRRERDDLRAIAAREGESMSDVIRDSLYRTHGVGELREPTAALSDLTPEPRDTMSEHDWDCIIRQDLRSEQERLKLRLLHLQAEIEETADQLDDVTARLSVLHGRGEDL